MKDLQPFWDTYAKHHFWRLNDKNKVKENSRYYDAVYDGLLPADRSVKIVDLGCGGGHFIYYLLCKGYSNIQGVDIAPGLVEFVREQIHSQIVCDDVFHYLGQHSDEFDVLTANDLIEHLPKSRIGEFLSLCQSALKPGGRLIIKTPNMDHPLAPHYRYIDFTHEVGFTEQSLYEVCAAADLQKITIHPGSPNRLGPWRDRPVRWWYRWWGEVPPRIASANLVAVGYKAHQPQ